MWEKRMNAEMSEMAIMKQKNMNRKWQHDCPTDISTEITLLY